MELVVHLRINFCKKKKKERKKERKKKKKRQALQAETGR